MNVHTLELETGDIITSKKGFPMTGMLGTKYRVFKAQAGDRDGCMVALKKIPYNVKR